LEDALEEAGLEEAGAPGEAVFFSDEMRLGLMGQVRRVWAPVGFEPVQKVQIEYEYAYLSVGVDPMTGDLKWDWTADMKADSLASVLAGWEEELEGHLEAVVWDGAPGHSGSEYAGVQVERVQQPPYSPELQPVERVFEHLRARIEGIVFETLDDKKAAVESELQALAESPETVKSLTGWEWIRRSLRKLRN
jgi:hypothetical protein